MMPQTPPNSETLGAAELVLQSRFVQAGCRLSPMCPLSGSATTIPEVYTETEDPEITAFQRHQNSAEKPTWAEAARTLMAGAR